MKRRSFIRTIGMATVSAVAFREMHAAGVTSEKLPRIGLIPSNTGGEWFKKDPKTALKKISEWGYKELEFGGDFGLGISPAEVKEMLKGLGIKPLIGSTSMGAMNNPEQLKSDIKKSLELGQEYIACYWPWTDDGQNKMLADWKKVAENLNKGGAICNKEGIKLIYHNHDIEFKITEGQIPFDTIMKELDPKLVSIELDLYWITKGGQSAVEFIKKYPGRYPVYHVKDMNPANKDFACVGSGNIDFAEIFRLNKTAGVKHFIVEHDKPENPEDCVASSAKYLLNLSY
jgi:Sugar phosphate isomerases/epimerases